MPGTPTVLHAGISGLPLSGSDYNDNLYLIENSFLDTGPCVISGLTVSIGLGLAVDVAAGVAVVGAELTVAPFSIGSLMPATTNHLYLLRTGLGTSNDTGIAPAGSVKLGTATTDGIGVTSVNMGRSSGRQQFRQPQDLVMGGPAAGTTSAGHPNSLNLADWNLTAAEGKSCYGVLPNGAQSHTDAAYTSPPAAASLTGLNISTATIADSASGGLWINAPNIGAEAIEGWYKTLAAGAYTWTVRLDALIAYPHGQAGLFLRDSASGKIITWGFDANSTFGYWTRLLQWSAPITFVNNAYSQNYSPVWPRWLKITDDGAVNRTYSISMNGTDWLDLVTEGRTTYLGVAPNQAGIWTSANGASAGLNVFSWAGA